MIKFFSRVDKVDDIVTSFGEPKSVGDVNRNLVRVLTSDYEVEQRTLFYRDEISPAQVENIVRQRHLRLPVSTGGNVGKAFWTSRQDNGGSGKNRNNRQRNGNNITDSSNGSNSSNSGDTSNSSNGNNNSNSSSGSYIPQSAYDPARRNWFWCLEPGHRWRECAADVSPAIGTNAQKNANEKVCCLASVLLGSSVSSCKEDPSKNTAEK